jgi:hypothetical protein
VWSIDSFKYFHRSWTAWAVITWPFSCTVVVPDENHLLSRLLSLHDRYPIMNIVTARLSSCITVASVWLLSWHDCCPFVGVVIARRSSLHNLCPCMTVVHEQLLSLHDCRPTWPMVLPD